VDKSFLGTFPEGMPSASSLLTLVTCGLPRYAIVPKNFVFLAKILPSEKIFFSQSRGEIIIFNIFFNS
jgi:hypothetical protein